MTLPKFIISESLELALNMVGVLHESLADETVAYFACNEVEMWNTGGVGVRS